MALVIGVSRCDRCSSDQDCQDNCERLQWFYSSVVLLPPADQKSLVLLLMRGAEVRKVLENVGVRFQAAGRAFALGQEREAVIDHVVSEDAAIGILRRLRRIEIQHVGQCSLLVDLGNRFFARVISCVAHQMHELIEPALSIVHRLARVVFQLRVVGVEKAADTWMARTIDMNKLAILPHAASSPDV